MINTSVFYKVRDFLPTNLQSFLRKIIWDNLQINWQLKSGLTIKVTSRADWWVYNEIFVNQEYDLAIKLALESTPSDRCFKILDLGANVGFFTLRVADYLLQSETPKRLFEATLIEGSPTVYKELKYRINRESFLTNKTNIIYGLVGELQGSATIAVSDFHIINSLTPQSSRGNMVEVPYFNINTLYNQDSEIDLLKCDIEGSELSFIENYRDLISRVRYAVFELHSNICNTNKCHEILREIGFINYKCLSGDVEREVSVYLFWK